MLLIARPCARGLGAVGGASRGIAQERIGQRASLRRLELIGRRRGLLVQESQGVSWRLSPAISAEGTDAGRQVILASVGFWRGSRPMPARALRHRPHRARPCLKQGCRGGPADTVSVRKSVGGPSNRPSAGVRKGGKRGAGVATSSLASRYGLAGIRPVRPGPRTNLSIVILRRAPAPGPCRPFLLPLALDDPHGMGGSRSAKAACNRGPRLRSSRRPGRNSPTVATGPVPSRSPRRRATVALALLSLDSLLALKSCSTADPKALGGSAAEADRSAQGILAAHPTGPGGLVAGMVLGRQEGTPIARRGPTFFRSAIIR
jgi:hypothetical protein